MTALPNILLPADDAARLQALGRYRLLDAHREQILDDVVAATAHLFRVSNAMLTMVEGTTVLLKAPYNLPVPLERLPREQSLCSATVLQNETAVFEDLNQKSAPGVDISLILQLGLHFYAGHNLRTDDGYNIGTLCLFDGPPRHFPSAERHLLSQLAALVMHLLELRRVMGPHSGLTALLWGTIYRSMSEQLAVLNNLAQHAGPPNGPLAPAVAQEASSIVANLDQLVANTLRRK
ncbi:GAF domain-containing protein [Hymenobacter negativus]|uniref:GAF domain-containing protein n=1 Tax=Hymenobacter negativus TaxID=2795026 RepID=A0ABS0Q6J6_9BACT|nr:MULTISPECIES: GAF domain-containing protein [Bacteria]MBH8558275.1 GAF domain-containing protein [Hymenobacter negativus]MBH8568764.1 GAF domain-containing protein [Hymenobacter negativus]MBR7208498.1 GAF domain-containing protein [Microvirga sp. STS02]